MLKVTTCLVIVLTIGFGQYLLPDQKDQNDVRLAPKLLNYQGFMTDTLNNPINDSVDILFRIYDAPSGGNLIWSENQIEVPILKGIFHVLLGTVTPIPDSVFTKSTDRWLELRISSQNLLPRTRFTASPYAYISDYADTAAYAHNAGADNDWTRAAGKVYTYNLTDTVGIRTIAPRYALDVNGVICGGVNDTVLAAYGAVLGGFSNLAGDAAGDTGAVVAGGIDNAALAKYATVGGGWNDTASYQGTTVAGGCHNVASSNMYATVGGGVGNVANGYSSTVAGGYYNRASFGGSAIGGGFNNYTGYETGTVGGGEADTARSWYSGVFSGYSNKAGLGSYDTAAVVAGGYNNSATGKMSFIGGGKNNIASGVNSTVSGGYTNWAPDIYSTVSGGMQNTASGEYSTVAGGGTNYASAFGATTGGGRQNTTAGEYSVIAGGYTNYIYADYAAILGGIYDTITATGNFSYLFGIQSRLTQDSTFMVDLPHIRFGKEANGYEFPVIDGSSGQVMVTNGAGQLSWGSSGDNDWIRSGGKVYTFNLTDTVGVRTAVPRYALDVNGVICGGTADTVQAVYGTVLGGYSNVAGRTAADTCAMVSGGYDNAAPGKYSYVGGGRDNHLDSAGTYINSIYSSIGGGRSNAVYRDYATIAGGFTNLASASYAVISGGSTNYATNSYTTVGGGYYNNASGPMATVGGGDSNIGSGAAAVVAGGRMNIASGYRAAVGGGYANNVNNSYSVIAGGYSNKANGYETVIGGGDINRANANWSAVLGGYYNVAGDSAADDTGQVIVGGWRNRTDAAFATVVGGDTNFAGGSHSFIGAGRKDSVTANWGAIVAGRFNLAGDAATDSFVFVGGGQYNQATAPFAAVVCGDSNLANGAYNIVCGGLGNRTDSLGGKFGDQAFLGSGDHNVSCGSASVVCGGRNNFNSGSRGFIGGGYSNRVGNSYAVCAGGYGNHANGYESVIGGGDTNLTGSDSMTGGSYATVPGGYLNQARGGYSFAAGYRAKARMQGDFVWGDSQNYDKRDTLYDAAMFFTSGGFYVYTGTSLGGKNAGVYVAAGASAWSSVSDRNLKENFQDVDGAEVLDKLAAMPIQTWNYKSQDQSIRHIGPMAQDFAAFGVGEDDKHITTIDADGIALVAIQELYKQNQELKKEIETLKEELKKR